jgi:WD40 repeat protein
LAVEKLNACHRLADVEAALQELPTGMESFYERMISSLPEDPVDKALALRILRCVVCATRTLTVTELSQALGQDSTELLDIHKSIVNLCGGFVVIDNDGNVSMVHQTAREYLQKSNNNLVEIKKAVAHEELFVSCLRCIMTEGLRSKLIRASNPEFLDYAATFWSSHLVALTKGSIICTDTLRKFLKGQAILTWIYFLTLRGKLRVLVLTSKNLTKFARRQDRQVEKSNEMMDRVYLEAWATDLIKLIGKFGLALRKNPECIYKEVPPLCPRNSAIYQQFGRLEGKNLQVLGISTEDWDDSLSRLPLPEGNFTSSILAVGSQIAMLVNSGSVFLYNSLTFQETDLSPINHKERIYRMEIDRAATQLVTYGYRTTKVWELSSGKCKLSVNNLQSRPRPLTMLLVDHNRRLLVGFDDRQIRSLDIETVDPVWETVADLEEPELDGHFLNSANYMTLSKDGSLIAVAYRGHPLSAWEVDGSVHLGHCWRTRDEVARGEVIEAVWNPQNPEVIGLYIEGVVFKWQPYNDYVEELPTGGSKLAIADDGTIFATGDAQGVVKLYTTADFGLLYQFASQDTVLGITFSPDARRIYDVRGYYGNVWEPNALIKHAEQTVRGFDNDADSESQALSSIVTGLRVHQRVDSITVLSSCPTGNLYCYGTERGMLYLHGINSGRIANLHTSKGLLSIECLAWSPNGSLLAFTDSSKKLFIIPLTFETGNKSPVVGLKLEIPLKDVTQGPIRQIIIHPTSSHIIVCTETFIHTILVSASSVQHSITLGPVSAHWIFHPMDDGQLLGFEPEKIYRVDWRSGVIISQKHDAAQIEEPEDIPDSSSGESKVDRVLVTLDKRHIMVQLSIRGLSKNTKKHVHFDVSAIPILRSSGLAGQVQVRVTTIHEEFSAQAIDVLAILPQNRLVYLSRDYSICLWKIPTWTGKASGSNSRPSTTGGNAAFSQTGRQLNIQGNPVRRLFSLPSDWVSRDCLNLSAVWIAERSFLCPRNGEVAIAKCATLA